LLEATLPMPEPTTPETRLTPQAVPFPGMEKIPEPSELSGLIQRVAAGERDALGELYDVTVGKLFALARLILRNDADSEEVVCDVYTQVWQEAAKYRGDRGGVLPWLLMICRSRAVDRTRRNRARLPQASREALPDDEASSPEPGPEDILNLVQQGTAVHRALQTLPPVPRQLVSLAFFSGLSHPEIAEKCRLPVGTVKSHIRRALMALRTELTEGEADV
jgi:RNA polymerase sigma-70 factor (ECF subfamily)